MPQQNSIRISHVPFFHIITPVEDHTGLKSTLLKVLDTIKNPVNNGNQKISNQDYFGVTEQSKKYVDLFVDSVRIDMQALISVLGVKDINIKNIWFQQYMPGDKHTWHTHEGCSLSNIYYLEAAPGIGTEFYNFETKQNYMPIKVKEGEILTFPSFIYHRTAPNTSDKRKTVIAFNTDLIG